MTSLFEKLAVTSVCLVWLFAGELENQLTKEEFLKMKQELEQEYLATFKKTVAMHEVFLQRLAAHPIFRNDMNFKVFLEYEQDVSSPIV